MSVFCVCSNSQYLTPIQELYIGLGSQAGIFLQIFYLGSSVLRTVQSIVNQSSTRTTVNTAVTWIFWAVVFLLQWVINSKRPFGEEHALSCRTCQKDNTIIWESINVYGFPDVYMITGFSYGALDLYYTWKETRSLQYKHATGLVILLFWYCYSEFVNGRTYIYQLLGNLGVTLFLVLVCERTIQIMQSMAPELFEAWIYVARHFPKSKRFANLKTE